MKIPSGIAMIEIRHATISAIVMSTSLRAFVTVQQSLDLPVGKQFALQQYRLQLLTGCVTTTGVRNRTINLASIEQPAFENSLT